MRLRSIRGGSATLVARVLGDAAASVQGAPSDGEERRVADGFFVYSDAPAGPASVLVVRPAEIVALPHAVVPIQLALVDAAGTRSAPRICRRRRRAGGRVAGARDRARGQRSRDRTG